MSKCSDSLTLSGQINLDKDLIDTVICALRKCLHSKLSWFGISQA